MAYSKSKELTATEKKMQTLKTQLFGKEGNQIKVIVSAKTDAEASIQGSTLTTSYQPQDLTYLKKDLRKIAMLAFLAIGTQLILYMQFTFKFLKI